MGKSITNFFKKQEKEKEKELQNRATQFLEEYSMIRARYQCDFQSYLEMIDGGEGGIKPKIRIVDATKQIEAEQAAEKLKAEATEKNERQDNGN